MTADVVERNSELTAAKNGQKQRIRAGTVVAAIHVQTGHEERNVVGAGDSVEVQCRHLYR